jgi:hypothetical protein
MAHRETLEEQLRNSLTEARMVLPGVQAILGFQLIAVFNERFAHELSRGEQFVHLVAFVLIAIAAGVIMTPAAYHRIAEYGAASDRFVTLASRLLEIALAPLAVGLSLDAFLLFRLILNSTAIAATLAALLLVFLTSLWFLFPYTRRLQNDKQRRRSRRNAVP